MIELLLCSLVTILPDYLYRRYRQGRRFGHEINFYTVWFELRWGIVSCLMLTVALITVIFYFHPSTKIVTSAFRTVSILPEMSGRVSEVYVGLNDRVQAGQPLFRLNSAQQEAALESARRTVKEVDAAMEVATTELAGVNGQIRQAEGAHRQALRELETKQELQRRSPATVAGRDIERLELDVDRLQGAIDAAIASRQTLQTRINVLLPAQKATAEAALARAQVDLDRTVVRAEVAGIVQQFALRPGDVVNPMLRPAGILVPTTDRKVLVAGFGQIEAQVIRKGMIAEVTCIGRPFAVIPMVVTEVQDVIAAGQVRGTDQVIDAAQLVRPGTITAFLEPLYAGGLDAVPLGGNCLANAYSNHHDEIASGKAGFLRGVFLHMVDAVAIVHAAILRVQAVMLPVQLLVFSGH
jgi:multidrug resistance efflux pump